jgi:hypothetical protein
MSDAVNRSRRRGSRVAAFAFAIGLAGILLGLQPAQAQPWDGRGSWCVDRDNGAGFDCAFYSYGQCMETARGLSNSCSRNPLYIPPQAKTARAQVRQRRHRSHH